MLASPAVPNRGAPGSGWKVTGAFEESGRDGEGWVQKGLNKIRSGELGAGKVLKKIRSDSASSNDNGNGAGGYVMIDDDDGAGDSLLAGRSNRGALAGNGGGGTGAGRNGNGTLANGNGKVVGKEGKDKQEWKGAGKLLKAFRAELNPVIGYVDCLSNPKMNHLTGNRRDDITSS